MAVSRARRTLGHRTWSVAAIGCLAAVLSGCATHTVPPISAKALAAARAFKEYTVYWAGLKVDGVRLTDADSPVYDNLYAPVGFIMYYGNCEDRGALHDGGCTLPLRITTTIYTPHSDASFGPQRWVQIHGVPAVIYDSGKEIEIYTDKQNVDIVADSAKRALAAAAALTTFNRAASAGFPAFPQPVYTPNPPQLNGSSGPVGPTGATAAIAPPPELEPAPSTGT